MRPVEPSLPEDSSIIIARLQATSRAIVLERIAPSSCSPTRPTRKHMPSRIELSPEGFCWLHPQQPFGPLTRIGRP